jgi:hypothetical protein
VSRPSKSSREEHLLGIDQPITRRDVLNGSLLAAGAGLLESSAPLRLMAQGEPWDGYGGIDDHANSHGNTEELMRLAHPSSLATSIG